MLIASGCAKKSDSLTNRCVQPSAEAISGSEGQAMVFAPDPITQTGDTSISPAAYSLDEYRKPASLQNLGGHGVLEGAYVDIRTNDGCDEGFGVYSDRNDFRFSHVNGGFQQAMTYYYGDGYRALLDTLGLLAPVDPVRIIAHCMDDDNAFYSRETTASGTSLDYVCLGDSVQTIGASYADDANVVIHELQHATTAHAYSPTFYFNNFFYDEAGAINEAISDFGAMTYLAPLVAPGLDERVFSRWALGTFVPGYSGVRGANLCPAYDPSYPNCASYDLGAAGFSADQNHVSFNYPDGLGWPYPNNYRGPHYLKEAHLSNTGQEEIHNVATVMQGALWDVFDRLRAQVGEEAARKLSLELVMSTIPDLPKPSAVNLSPVTMRGLAQALVNRASAMGFTAPAQTAVSEALMARGLIGGTPLPNGWAAVGDGNGVTAGMKIEDGPTRLRIWARMLGQSSGVIPQGVSASNNGRLSKSEYAAIWFDIKNTSAITAGGLQITVKSLNPKVTVLDGRFNVGAQSSSQAQIQYLKANGTGIVSALSSANANAHVGVGNSYFKTNPYYSDSPRTAVWVSVNDAVTANEDVDFEVKIVPTNGPEQTLVFTTKVN